MLYLFYLNTAKVVLLFVLTKYFSTFIRIIFNFFCILTTPPTTHNSTPTATPSTASSAGRWARPRPVWRVRPHIHSRPPRRAHATLLSAAGSLACESKLQGKIEDSDCSNYQLFRCPSWDVFYRSACRLKRWLLTFYRGERIIRNVRNTLNSDRFYSKIRNKKTISKEKYTKTI